jgi:hypothetical protein
MVIKSKLDFEFHEEKMVSKDLSLSNLFWILSMSKLKRIATRTQKPCNSMILSSIAHGFISPIPLVVRIKKSK